MEGLEGRRIGAELGQCLSLMQATREVYVGGVRVLKRIDMIGGRNANLSWIVAFSNESLGLTKVGHGAPTGSR